MITSNQLLNLFPIIFAGALQIQMYYQFNGRTLNLSLSDFILPLFLGSFLLFAPKKVFFSLKKISLFPWLLPCLGILTLSLLMGPQNSWAIWNKYAGFYVLLAYFLAGSFFHSDARNLELFSLSFFLIFNTLSLIYIGLVSLDKFEVTHTMLRASQLMGFTNNPNILGFLGCISLCAFVSYRKHPLLSGHWGLYALIITLFSITASSSRASWLCAIILILYASFKKVFLPKKFLTPVAIISLLTLSAILVQGPKRTIKNTVCTSKILRKKKFAHDPSVQERLMTVKRAYRLIQEKPLLGHGLGFYTKNFIVKELRSGNARIIHNTLLWLVVETGIIGAICFLGLFFTVLDSVVMR